MNKITQTITKFQFSILFILLFFVVIESYAQNAIVGSGFSSGWGGGSCPTGNGNFKYLSLVTGTGASGTYGVTTTANGTGDQFFRFGVDWSGTTAQLTRTIGVDNTVVPNTTYSLNTTCTTSGALRYNVPNASYNYVFKTLNAGTAPTGTFVFFEIQGAVRSVSSVSQLPSNTNVTSGNATVITANINGSLATGQAIYLRYTKDNYSNSTVVQMTGSGTTYTASIPGAFNTTGAVVSYYIFTSGTTNVAVNGSNADLYTINLNNNGGPNYSYTVLPTPVPVVTSGSPTGTFNTNFSYSIVASNSPTSYAVANGSLPPGLILNTVTGAITGTPTAAGTYVANVTATNSGGTSSPAELNFTIAKANQTISFDALTARTYGDAPFTLGATASSVLNVSYSSSNTSVATISGNTLIIVGAGTTIISASQAGDNNFNTAVSVDQTLIVNVKNLIITGVIANNKVQDGTTTATLSGAPGLSGIVTGDESQVSITGTPIATFSSALPGTGIPVAVSGFSLAGAKGANYSVSQPTGLTADILALGVPTAITATDNLPVGFTANWTTVLGANSYVLDVRTDFENVQGFENLNVGNVTSYTVTGLDPQTQYFYSVRAVNGSVTTANSNEISVTTKPVSCTWNGTAWSNTTGPDADIEAVIAGVYTTAANGEFTAKKVTVNSGSLTVNSGNSITVVNEVVNNLTAAEVVVENNGNLIQTADVDNTGAVTVKRNSSLLKRLDYTLWSSPVVGQNLLSFSPQTITSRFYQYNSTTNFYESVPSPSTTAFEAGKGFLIRTPNNHPAVTPTAWTGQFVGVPHNGNYSVTMQDAVAGERFNLVGNPYPSPISALSLVENANNSGSITGTLYFWRKTNGSANPSYCTWTSGGFVTNNDDQTFDLNDVIQTGQAFFVEATGTNDQLLFTNEMRADNNANQFFRNAQTTNAIERNRVWLNATSSTGAFSQTMIGYMTNASNGLDTQIDGKYINDGEIALTSLLDATPMAIQGRALPFDAADVVPMRFKATTAGTYTIAIDHVDGLFANGQTVFLRDNVTGVTHNLSDGAYTFAVEAGTFDSRFEVVYQYTLGTDTPVLTRNQVVVYAAEAGAITINSGNVQMNAVKIFDIRGRLLTDSNNINASQTTMHVSMTNEVLLVQITAESGEIITKKFVN